MKRTLPRLSRGWKIVRNLAFVLAFLVAAWAVLGYPMSAEQRFRSIEHSYWVGPSDIQYVGGSYGIVGTYMDQVLIAGGRDWLEFWPRNPDGPTLVPLAQNDLLAADVPDGTAAAKLTLELSFYYFSSDVELGYIPTTYAVRERAEQERSETADFWQDTYLMQGELQDEGGILFHAEPQGPFDPDGLNRLDELPLLEATDRDTYSQDPWENGAWARMMAIFYDETGAELGRAALSTPEGN